MKRSSIGLLSVLTVLVLLAASVPVFAQRPFDLTVRAGDNVGVPDHLLTPGHYILQRVDSVNPTAYRLTNEDTMKVVDVFNVIPDRRSTFGKTAVTLSAPDAAGLRMIQAWFPAGGMHGYQFVYSNKDVRKLDKMARSEHITGPGAGQP